MRRLSLTIALLAVLFNAGYSLAQASVSIADFSAVGQPNKIVLNWTTGNEVNNVGFNMLRSTAQNGTYSKINPTLIPSNSFGSVTGSDYSYNDTSLLPNQTYFYKLQSVDLNGNQENFGPVSASLTGASTPGTAVPTATTVPTVAPSATRQPSATPTSLPPTNTPLPTNTVIPPTNTPVATATPLPSSTPALATSTALPANTSIPNVRATATRAPVATQVVAQPTNPAAAEPTSVPIDASPTADVRAQLVTPAPADSSPSPTVEPTRDIRAEVAPTLRAPVKPPAATAPPSENFPGVALGVIAVFGVAGIGLIGLATVMFVWIVREYRQ